ncbi:MAG: MerR family transcriptional regulator [Streptomyces sp.]|nr:MerR family transcriptional regulator [Streptomyces sp.]
MDTGLRVGELAAKADISAPTVRYYEREGLLAPARRSEAGYRLYGPEALKDLRFIARAKALGLSLEQIRLLRSQPDAEAERRQLRHLVAHQLVRTRRQRAELEALEENLAVLFAALVRQGGSCPCPPQAHADGPEDSSGPAAAVLVDEVARIEAAECRCGCALDPGCTCGCPCCAFEGAGHQADRTGV